MALLYSLMKTSKVEPSLNASWHATVGGIYKCPTSLPYSKLILA